MMSESKSIIIFIMLSVVLLFGISLLPESPVLVPSSVTMITTQWSIGTGFLSWHVIEAIKDLVLVFVRGYIFE